MLDFIITDSEAKRLLLNCKAAFVLGLFLFVGICFTAPKILGHRPFGQVAEFVVLWPASLLIGTVVYVVILLFRVGMRRSASSSISNPSNHP